jgi:hypothetical protein
MPQRLTIHPGSIVLQASQAQRFEVTDADGKPVPVRWDVSGIDCSGSACGTIDGSGTYRAPQSLAHGFVVVLEGFLVSDPKHSVLTRVQVSPAKPVEVNASNANGAQSTRNSSARWGSRLPPLQESGETFLADAVSRKAPVHSTVGGPLVSYQGGQLTIDAENTTLAALLALVAEKTGAVIDIPHGSGMDPVVEHAGPGPANEVIAQLLNGSPFNFIIVGSPLYPEEPAKVLLSLKPGNGNSAAAAPAQPIVPPAALAEGLSAPAVPAETAAEIAPPVAKLPTEQMTPDEIEQAMKARAQELREKAQQQNTQTQ